MSSILQAIPFAFSNGGDDEFVDVAVTGVTAGSSLIVCIQSGGGAANRNCVVNDGSAYTLGVRSTRASALFLNSEIHHLHAASAGSHTVNILSAGGDFDLYGGGVVLEVAGLANAAPDVTATAFNDNSAAPVSGTTSATTQATAMAIASLCINTSSSDIGIDLPSGYTNRLIDQSGVGDGIARSVDTLVLSTTGAQSASWGALTGTVPWAGAIAVYKDALAAANAPYFYMRQRRQ